MTLRELLDGPRPDWVQVLHFGTGQTVVRAHYPTGERWAEVLDYYDATVSRVTQGAPPTWRGVELAVGNRTVVL